MTVCEAAKPPFGPASPSLPLSVSLGPSSSSLCPSPSLQPRDYHPLEARSTRAICRTRVSPWPGAPMQMLIRDYPFLPRAKS